MYYDWRPLRQKWIITVSPHVTLYSHVFLSNRTLTSDVWGLLRGKMCKRPKWTLQVQRGLKIPQIQEWHAVQELNPNPSHRVTTIRGEIVGGYRWLLEVIHSTGCSASWVTWAISIFCTGIGPLQLGVVLIGPILDDRLKEKLLKPWKGAHSSHFRVSVYTRVTEHSFWPRNLSFGLNDPWDRRKK